MRCLGFIFAFLQSWTTFTLVHASAAELLRLGQNGNLCIRPAITLEKTSEKDPRFFPERPRAFGIGCDGSADMLNLIVTQENFNNNHLGSRNHNQNIAAYVSDFDFKKDFGRWVRAGVRSESGEPILSLGLNTKDFDEVNSITGWRLRFGHLFVSLTYNKMTFPLDRNVVIEFDVRINKSDVYKTKDAAYSGHRVLVGALARWKESPPRENTAHFLALDLLTSDNFSLNYNESRRESCRDLDYDRCFYDKNGRFPEGREIDFEKMLRRSPLGEERQTWTRVKIPICEIYRTLTWASKPQDWHEAIVKSIYIGVESMGATDTDLDIKNFQVLDLTNP